MIRILSTLAVQGGMQALSARHAPLDVAFAPTLVLLDRIRAGEAADAVILTRAGIDALVQEGVLDPGSIVDVALSRVGLAVLAGAPHPDIATPAALTRALLAGPVAYSRAGASGVAFAALIRTLGIADAVNARARVIPEGFTAELLVRGEAMLAVQQVSELMVVPGIEIAGTLPDELVPPALFSAALTRTGDPAASAFLRSLVTPEAATILRGCGLEPPP